MKVKLFALGVLFGTAVASAAMAASPTTKIEDLLKAGYELKAVLHTGAGSNFFYLQKGPSIYYCEGDTLPYEVRSCRPVTSS